LSLQAGVCSRCVAGHSFRHTLAQLGSHLCTTPAGPRHARRREVRTKASKTAVTYFSPVGDDIREVVEG
jgi:hypothetical protein